MGHGLMSVEYDQTPLGVEADSLIRTFQADQPPGTPASSTT